MPLDQNPHRKSGPFWVRRLFNVCVLVFCAPNATIFLVYILAKIKMSFIWKDNFFLPKSASSVRRSQAYLAKHIQTYTQPYSFGGRIKLIICQIRHELSVTIHEISTSCKKTLNGGPYITVQNSIIVKSKNQMYNMTTLPIYDLIMTCFWYIIMELTCTQIFLRKTKNFTTNAGDSDFSFYFG